MEIKKVGNTYRKKKWYERNSMFWYTLLAVIFWAIVMVALFIL